MRAVGRHSRPARDLVWHPSPRRGKRQRNARMLITVAARLRGSVRFVSMLSWSDWFPSRLKWTFCQVSKSRVTQVLGEPLIGSRIGNMGTLDLHDWHWRAIDTLSVGRHILSGCLWVSESGRKSTHPHMLTQTKWTAHPVLDEHLFVDLFVAQVGNNPPGQHTPYMGFPLHPPPSQLTWAGQAEH